MKKQSGNHRPHAKKSAQRTRAVSKRRQTRGRAQRLQNKSTRQGNTAQPNVGKVLANLPLSTFEQLRGVWKNCLVKLADKNQSNWHQAASEILTAIELEWQRRSRMVHPEDWFKWPSTDASGGDGKLVLKPSVSDGMLSYLDYRVGGNGEVNSIRHGILSRVFEGSLPPVFPPDYMSSWGAAKSASRLRKLAESLAAFARNAKRRRDITLNDAISDWEADLRFLFEHYYLDRFSFAWPLTRV
jgi:hypothetical protein